jgi:subtilisin family serine protease
MRLLHRFVSSLPLLSLLGWSIDARLLLRGGQDDGAERSQLTKNLRPGRRTQISALIAETFDVQDDDDRHTRGEEAEDQEERIYVQYKSKKGHDRAIQHATIVHQDADDDDVLIMSCVNCLETLRNMSSIVEVSIDHPIEAFGSIVGPARTLEEIIPWGLHVIQADQLTAGGDGVKVCIVDTGLAVGHPDFNYDFISGTDTVKDDGSVWQWSVDKSECERNKNSCDTVCLSI